MFNNCLHPDAYSSSRRRLPNIWGHSYLFGELSWPQHLTSCDPVRCPWGQTSPQLRPREENWGPISSIHMRNIQLGFSTSFLTTPNILRKPSNMKRENSNKMNNKSRNNDRKWKIKMTLFFIYKWKIQWSDRKISDMWRTIICRLKRFNIKVIIVMDNLLKTNN